MKKKNFDLDCIVFVCTNERSGAEASCGKKGGSILREELKALVKSGDQFKGKKIRVSQSGCLGRCQEGIATLVMPHGEWIVEAESKSATELAKEIKILVGDF